MSYTTPSVVGGVGSVLTFTVALTLGRLLAVAASEGPVSAEGGTAWHEDDAARGFLRGAGRLADLVAVGAAVQAGALAWQADALRSRRSQA